MHVLFQSSEVEF